MARTSAGPGQSMRLTGAPASAVGLKVRPRSADLSRPLAVTREGREVGLRPAREHEAADSCRLRSLLPRLAEIVRDEDAPVAPHPDLRPQGDDRSRRSQAVEALGAGFAFDPLPTSSPVASAPEARGRSREEGEGRRHLGRGGRRSLLRAGRNERPGPGRRPEKDRGHQGPRAPCLQRKRARTSRTVIGPRNPPRRRAGWSERP